jgi:dephospho-CoA kinase
MSAQGGSRPEADQPLAGAKISGGKKVIVIGVIGKPGSGKDTVTDYLTKKYKGKVIKFADPLNEMLHVFVDHVSREDQQWLSFQMRKRFGQDIFAKVLRKRILSGDSLIILNGIRFWENIEFLKSFKNNYSLFIDVNPKTRWKRVFGRKEKKDDKVSFKKFQELDNVETEDTINAIGQKADFIINNEGDSKTLLRTIDAIMQKILKK